ncbi:hypothetical protein [Rothia sp. 11254D007CT]
MKAFEQVRKQAGQEEAEPVVHPVSLSNSAPKYNEQSAPHMVV